MPDDLDAHPIGELPPDDDPLLSELRHVREAINTESRARAQAFKDKAAAEAVQREKDEAEQAQTTKKTRRRIAFLAAAVAVDLLLSVGVIRTQHRQDEADKKAEEIRVESRRNLCEFINTGIERDRRATEALIIVSTTPDPSRPRTPEQQDRTEQAIREYVRLQGMRYDATGRVVAATINCARFAKDPANTKPQFPGGK